MKLISMDLDLPSGKISQVRLKLGDQNSVKIDGETHELKTPSGQQSGLKLKIDATLTEGISYSVLLDFDAARSVVKAGNSGNFNLKPVIRVITAAVDSAIKGNVNPATAFPAVFAIIGEDTLGTSFANENGNFMILGLDAGTYNVSFAPQSEYAEKTIENVEVAIGNVTDFFIINYLLFYPGIYCQGIFLQSHSPYYSRLFICCIQLQC